MVRNRCFLDAGDASGAMPLADARRQRNLSTRCACRTDCVVELATGGEATSAPCGPFTAPYVLVGNPFDLFEHRSRSDYER
jgi:hypothetical protein